VELYNLPTRIAMAQETFKQEVCASSDTERNKSASSNTELTGRLEKRKIWLYSKKKKEYSSIAFREEVIQKSFYINWTELIDLVYRN